MNPRTTNTYVVTFCMPHTVDMQVRQVEALSRADAAERAFAAYGVREVFVCLIDDAALFTRVTEEVDLERAGVVGA